MTESNIQTPASNLQLTHADARHLPLADESVQCIVTSPPYWGLRKYSGKQESQWGGDPECPHLMVNGGYCNVCQMWEGAYGLEPTIEMYIAHTVEILRECQRVLRSDGVLFWNIGDSYANDGKWGGETGGKQAYLSDDDRKRTGRSKRLTGLKPKDLCLIPSRVAIAAQADGWWIRSMIIWSKRNPMPESVTDRPTDAYEHILMLTKSERYFWDADAVREPAATGWNGSSFTDERDELTKPHLGHGSRSTNHESRNLRNVWTFATQPYSGAHFATFPEEIPRRCILAATSAKGACSQCGAPWERVCRDAVTSGKSWNGNALKSAGVNRNENSDFAGSNFYDSYLEAQPLGWKPTCLCHGQRGKTAPCLVLDPFGGSGTTGRVAIELGRRAVLTDIAYDAEYLALAQERTRNVQITLPAL